MEMATLGKEMAEEKEWSCYEQNCLFSSSHSHPFYSLIPHPMQSENDALKEKVEELTIDLE